MPVFSVPLQLGASGSYTSEVLHLVGYSNAAGTRPALMTVSWREMFNDGTISSVLIQHSDDNSTWATLWSIGSFDTTEDSQRTLYSWKPFIRFSATYAAGSDTEDAGARLAVDFRIWSLPDWAAASICRWEDIAALRPMATDPADGMQAIWPDQARIAKRRIEVLLRCRNVDPNKLLLDGHESAPCVEGLITPGAYLTLALILGSGTYRGEQAEKDRAYYEQMFETTITEALESGLAIYDADGNGAPGEDEGLRDPPNWVL